MIYLNDECFPDMDPECMVYIGGLDKARVRVEVLEEMCVQVGPVEHATLSNDKSYAFVEFDSPESALFACKMLDGICLYGRNIKVRPKKNTETMRLYCEYLAECWRSRSPDSSERDFSDVRPTEDSEWGKNSKLRIPDDAGSDSENLPDLQNEEHGYSLKKKHCEGSTSPDQSASDTGDDQRSQKDNSQERDSPDHHAESPNLSDNKRGGSSANDASHADRAGDAD